jgi:hypothetical protein
MPQDEEEAPAEPSAPSPIRLLGSDRGEDSHGADRNQLPVLVAVIAKGDGEVRVTLDEYKGALTIDVRLFEPFTTARASMPTRKGVTLGLAKLPALARALAEAEAVARKLGLLGDGG